MTVVYILTMLVLSPDLVNYTNSRTLFYGEQGAQVCRYLADKANQSGITATCKAKVVDDD